MDYSLWDGTNSGSIRDNTQSLSLIHIFLSEMKVRIARLLKLQLLEQIDVPLAVLIGKCDAWIHLRCV